MIVFLALIAGGVIASIGIGCLVVGRNRYGEMASRTRNRGSPRSGAPMAQVF